MNPLERGAKRYRDKKYESALEAFDEVTSFLQSWFLFFFFLLISENPVLQISIQVHPTKQTQAVKVSTGHILVTALDHRAATYEKMREYKKALKDAKAMIEEQPACAKGYLRSGKILELWKKSEVALQLYELGLKRVKVGQDEKRPVSLLAYRYG